MAVMAVYPLGAFLQGLFQQLDSTEVLSFAGRVGLRKKFVEWSDRLKLIEAVLADADEKQQPTDRAVKRWLDDLRDLAYDVDDILDGVAMEESMGKHQASTTKVLKFIPTCCTAIPNPNLFRINFRLESEINNITNRLNALLMLKDQLNLKETADGRSSSIRILAPTSVMVDRHVYGREKDKKAVIELLLGEKYCSDAEVSVIPIVGMGGIGKSTLAQLVYNDERVQSHFDLKAWVCVSEDFDAVRVTKAILKSVNYGSCDDNDLNLLQVTLKETLTGTKFLIVLDDVWNENYHEWMILRAPFLAGVPGSTIIITTRSMGVSSMTGTGPTYKLEVLSKDACWSLFTRHAFTANDFSAHPNLEDLAEKIIERCKGLPLALKTLGGLLRTKRNRDEWEDVLQSKMWDILEARSEIFPILMLSYQHMPSHLKRCFAYCSLLPKDYEFEEKQLVLLWMAEGLIHPREGKQMEDLGSEYFHSLLARSFFQQVSGDGSRFAMHELINDLAQSVAGDIYFRMGDGFGQRISKRARHLTYLGGEMFEGFSELTCLRTFLHLMPPEQGGYHHFNHNFPLGLSKLRRLRVLSLSGYYIIELPDSIGDLTHLRYLDLSNTSIESMPETTTTLFNLQTLLLENCPALKKLPSMFRNLVNLRHLDIRKTSSLEGMPLQMGKLTCLQTLSDFVVGKGPRFGIKELGLLLHLRETLHISRLENVIQPGDATGAHLIRKANLGGLLLEWSPNLDESQDKTIVLEVLNQLQPHRVLKELTIRCYGGTEFPTWLRTPSFPNMVLLSIENCKECTFLPPVGQLPSLKVLSIRGMARVKNVGFEFYGEGSSQPFRSLESLYFENMAEWENWTPIGKFSQLRELSIQNCPKLCGKLPGFLPLEVRIKIDGCPMLEYCNKYPGQEWFDTDTDRMLAEHSKMQRNLA